MLMNNNHHNNHYSWDSYSPPLSDQTSSIQTSPVANSQWSCHEQQQPALDSYSYSNYTGLLASIVREEGYVYSLAAIEDTLYTGSDSKNIRVWKNRKEFAGFKSTSGLVKSIVIADDKIFTGHRDGKIRVWHASGKDPSVYKKIGTLPNLSSIVEKAIKPKNYTEVWRNHRAIWIKHFDVISSLGLTEDRSLLYSGSWDKTIKVWRVSSFKCLESIPAHDDAVNAVVAGFGDFLFSGSADGAVKVWRREVPGKRTKHSLVRNLLSKDCAVTSLVVDPSGSVVYAGLSDGLLHYWEREKLLSSGSRVLRCHNSAVLCLAVAGSLVISGSADTNICVWRREDETQHKCVCVLRGHSGPVKCLAVEMSRCDGVGERSWTVYSGSLDRSVKIWRVCTQVDEEEPQASKKDRSRRGDNVGFETFTDQGRLNECKK